MEVQFNGNLGVLIEFSQTGSWWRALKSCQVIELLVINRQTGKFEQAEIKKYNGKGI